MIETLNLVIVVLLVLANGFFVASEFALVGVRKSRIETLAKSGDGRAKRLLPLLNNLNGYISATQLGITLASLALGWIGEPAIAHLLEAPLRGRISETLLHTIAFAIAFSIITFLHIVLGELAPKTLALERAEKTALAIALPMQLFYRVFRWPIQMLDWAGTRTVRLFGLHPSSGHASIYTEEELRQLIDISHASGHLQADEQRLINRVFDFSDAQVREAMVPRTAVAALPVTATLDETKKAFRNFGYSRLAVYEGTLDNVVGVLVRRDLEPFLDQTTSPAEFNLRGLIHTPHFIPAAARLGSALKQMQAKRMHLAFVVDEHGGTEGIVTLEDLLEEIVGEINDEFDEEVREQILKEADGSYLLSGILSVRDANRQLKLELPEDSGYTTLAGFLMARAGRLPQTGEVVQYEDLTFRIERMEGRRVRRVRLTSALKSALSAAAFLALSGDVICINFTSEWL
ncbi:MAG TPA: hemolysin family protein [Pyrinomonadaceae bacterium]|nr:hemolysin family protein [Pyrinomonadaceae bacterium]